VTRSLPIIRRTIAGRLATRTRRRNRRRHEGHLGTLPRQQQTHGLEPRGGTVWETTRTLRYYLDQYHLFDASGSSTGMDDTYGIASRPFVACSSSTSSAVSGIASTITTSARDSAAARRIPCVLDIARSTKRSSGSPAWRISTNIRPSATDRSCAGQLRSRRLTFSLSSLTGPGTVRSAADHRSHAPGPGSRSGSRSRTRRATQSQSERRRPAAGPCCASTLPRAPPRTRSNGALGPWNRSIPHEVGIDSFNPSQRRRRYSRTRPVGSGFKRKCAIRNRAE